MFTIEILIPAADNDGAKFSAEELAAFEGILGGLFGGFSRLPGKVAGGWVDAGRVYHDESFVYVVAVSSITEGAKVASVVEDAKARFRQEAIFIRYLGLAEVL